MAGIHLVVPATHVVWIPPQVPHSLRSHGAFNGWSLYITAEVCNHLPETPCTLLTSGLLNEAAIRLMQLPANKNEAFRHILMLTIVNKIALLKKEPIGLPLSQDRRLQRE